MSSPKRKHIKKRLMSEGVSRNAAETKSCGIMYAHIMRSFISNWLEHQRAERRKNAIHFLGYADSDCSLYPGNDDQLRKDR